MATVFELQKNYGLKYTMKCAWEEICWYKLNIIGLVKSLFLS